MLLLDAAVVAVGSELGLWLRSELGAEVGQNVSPVGLVLLGEALGPRVGDGVGKSVGGPLGPNVGDKVGSELGLELSTALLETVPAATSTGMVSPSTVTEVKLVSAGASNSCSVAGGILLASMETLAMVSSAAWRRPPTL